MQMFTVHIAAGKKTKFFMVICALLSCQSDLKECVSQFFAFVQKCTANVTSQRTGTAVCDFDITLYGYVYVTYAVETFIKSTNLEQHLGIYCHYAHTYIVSV